MEQDSGRMPNGLTLRADEHTELRVVRLEDAEELFAVIERNRERLYRWLPWIVPGYSMTDMRRFLTENASDFEERRSLPMTMRHRGKLCGAIALHRIDQGNRSTSIGYWIDGAHEGKGIITAACRTIITEGFDHFGLHRIEIRCATWNHRSAAVPRRLDFVEEGTLREAEWLHGKWVDLRVFSMLARDWRG
jgi:ribosomal-protein-serine acetyltransferase